ncbi:MAG TPA: hypothetical protein DDX03_06050 [Firmicutes bacterium]|nr:hypothetical protein [Bacillota bacterium]HBL67138.1 hypothetical protein [Bacillota bacterium]
MARRRATGRAGRAENDRRWVSSTANAGGRADSEDLLVAKRMEQFDFGSGAGDGRDAAHVRYI